MKQITQAEFLDGYQKGTIDEVILDSEAKKWYGKDRSGKTENEKYSGKGTFEVVWCSLP